MMLRIGRTLALAVLGVSLGACTSGSDTTGAAATSAVATTDPSSTPTVLDLTPTIMDTLAGKAEPFTDLEPGTYAIDPDLDPSTPLRVTWEIPAGGWKSWIGAGKFSDAGWVSVSITTVSNLVTHGCRDHSWADPPVGPSVEDLATSLADLAPFRLDMARSLGFETEVAGEGTSRDVDVLLECSGAPTALADGLWRFVIHADSPDHTHVVPRGNVARHADRAGRPARSERAA